MDVLRRETTSQSTGPVSEATKDTFDGRLGNDDVIIGSDQSVKTRQRPRHNSIVADRRPRHLLMVAEMATH